MSADMEVASTARSGAPPGSVPPEMLDLIVRRMVDTVHPLRIILFGSAARGEMGKHSDVDVLVVMPDGTHPRKTAQLLHMNMFGVPLAVDVVVATPSVLARDKDSFGLIYREALRDGKVLYVARAAV